MNNYPQIASRVLNTPLLLEPGYARVFFSALASRLGITQLQDAEGEILTGQKIRMTAESFSGGRERDRPYQLIDGVAVLPVSGSLVHKYGYLRPASGMTGYDGIMLRAQDALSDPQVKGILLDNHTPGGEVSGCFDTTESLRAQAEAAGKPIWSLCYDMNCSAGMALASAASRRLITQTGYAGSVGVVMAHASYEDHLEQEGIKVTLIHSGAHKTDGNPYEDLPTEVLERFQSDTDTLRQQFAALVARNLGMTTEAVLATEAAIYRGQAAIDVGFADALVNGHEAIAEFSEYLSTQGRTITVGALSMSEQNPAPAAETAPPAQATSQADNQATITAAADAERDRVRGILQHAEAEGRTSLAEHLAYETSMSVDEAGRMLAAAPKAADSQLDASTALDRLMESEQQPNLTAGASSGESETPEARRIAESWASATGVKLV